MRISGRVNRFSFSAMKSAAPANSTAKTDSIRSRRAPRARSARRSVRTPPSAPRSSRSENRDSARRTPAPARRCRRRRPRAIAARPARWRHRAWRVQKRRSHSRLCRAGAGCGTAGPERPQPQHRAEHREQRQRALHQPFMPAQGGDQRVVEMQRDGEAGGDRQHRRREGHRRRCRAAPVGPPDEQRHPQGQRHARPGRGEARHRPLQWKFRQAVLAEHAPIAADRAFQVALPGLIEGLDDVVIEAADMGEGQELADEARLLRSGPAPPVRAAVRRRDSRSRRRRSSCRERPPRRAAGCRRYGRRPGPPAPGRPPSTAGCGW